MLSPEQVDKIRAHKDPPTAVAAIIYSIPEAAVTPAQRAHGKNLWFAFAYRTENASVTR